MRNILYIAFLCLFCCALLPATAESKLFLSLYATGGEHSFAAEQDLNSDPLSGLKLSLDFEGGKNSNDFSLEGTYNQFTTENLLDGSQLDTVVTRLDVIYPLLQKTSWRPFLTVGIGRMFFDGPDNKPQDEDIVAYGGGLKYLITEYLTLRAEGRHELIFNREDGNIDNYEYTASVGYTFGKRKPHVKKPKPKKEPKPEPKPEPKISDDDDLDGVKNPVDRCPGTPAGIKVDSSGCAEQTPNKPSSFREEVVPVPETQDVSAEENIVVAAVSTTAPAVSVPAPLKEEIVQEKPKPEAVQEETPPAYVLPSLPTVIAIPALPPEEQSTAVSGSKTTVTPSTQASGGIGAVEVLQTIAAIPVLPVAAVVALVDAVASDKGTADKSSATDTHESLEVDSDPTEKSGSVERNKKAIAAASDVEHAAAVPKSAVADGASTEQPATIQKVAEAPSTKATAARAEEIIDEHSSAEQKAATGFRSPDKKSAPPETRPLEKSALAVTAPVEAEAARAVEPTTEKQPTVPAIDTYIEVADTAVKSSAIPTTAQQPITAADPGIKALSITSTSADAPGSAPAKAMESSALPAIQQLPGLLPVPTLAASGEQSSSVKEAAVDPDSKKETSPSAEEKETVYLAGIPTVAPGESISDGTASAFSSKKALAGQVENVAPVLTSTENDAIKNTEQASSAASGATSELAKTGTPLGDEKITAAPSTQASGGIGAVEVLQTIAAIPVLPVAAVVALVDAVESDKGTADKSSATDTHESLEVDSDPTEKSGSVEKNKKAIAAASDVEHAAAVPKSAVADGASTEQPATIQKVAEAPSTKATAARAEEIIDEHSSAEQKAATGFRSPDKKSAPPETRPLEKSALAVTAPVEAEAARAVEPTTEKQPTVPAIDTYIEVADTAVKSSAIPTTAQQPITAADPGIKALSITSTSADALGSAPAKAMESSALPAIQQLPGLLPVPTLAASGEQSSSVKEAAVDPDSKKETSPSAEEKETVYLAGIPTVAPGESISDGTASAAVPKQQSTEQAPAVETKIVVAATSEPGKQSAETVGTEQTVVLSAENNSGQEGLPAFDSQLSSVTDALTQNIDANKLQQDGKQALQSQGSPGAALKSQSLAGAPTGTVDRPAQKPAPITIPVCSGLPPHAILMLGKSGSDLLNVSMEEAKNEPKPFRPDATFSKKSHVPAASFDFDAWRLAPQAQKVLSLLVQQLIDSKLDFAIRVEGHTDSVGSETYNYNLSVRRAKSVATYLTEEKGIDPTRISTAGCGEWKPLASNETDEGRKLNRRFELVILPSDGEQ